MRLPEEGHLLEYRSAGRLGGWTTGDSNGLLHAGLSRHRPHRSHERSGPHPPANQRMGGMAGAKELIRIDWNYGYEWLFLVLHWLFLGTGRASHALFYLGRREGDS